MTTPRQPAWSADEIRLCALAFRLRGADTAKEVLALCGFTRTTFAIRDKMRKLNLTPTTKRNIA